MNPRVFVVEPYRQNGVNVGRAAAHGSIKYLFAEHGSRPSIWADDFVPMLLARLEHNGFDPERDFFAVVGHMVTVVMSATAIVAKYGSARGLYYSSANQHYVERQLGNPQVPHEARGH